MALERQPHWTRIEVAHVTIIPDSAVRGTYLVAAHVSCVGRGELLEVARGRASAESLPEVARRVIVRAVQVCLDENASLECAPLSPAS